MNKYGYSKSDQQVLNDIAYFWQEASFNSDAIWLLEKIIDNNPERVVAYLNLADAYWSEGEKQAAQKNYNMYVSIMTKQGKQQKIPSRVIERYDSKRLRGGRINKDQRNTVREGQVVQRHAKRRQGSFSTG
ncbi:hypothetical protein V2J93_26690 [Pseudomonas alliivorans]|nr:hypothetical protein [Pseudomonas alliivorans]